MSFDFNQQYPDYGIPLQNLGFDGKELELIRAEMKIPVGAVFIAGITGADCHHTIHACVGLAVESSSAKRSKVRAVGNAFDYPVFDPNKPQSGLRKAMLSALSSDPDLLLMSEIRDSHSGNELLYAVQSGYKTLTSVHASNVFSIVPRLNRLGFKVEPEMHRYEISALIYQAKMPVLCEKCSVGFAEICQKSPEWSGSQVERIESFFSADQLPNLRFKNSNGCNQCRNGIVGLTLVAEVIKPDEKMLGLMIEEKQSEARDYHREMGGRTVFDNALSKVLSGAFDIRDVEARLGILPTADSDNDDSRSYFRNPAWGQEPGPAFPNGKFPRKYICAADPPEFPVQGACSQPVIRS